MNFFSVWWIKLQLKRKNQKTNISFIGSKFINNVNTWLSWGKKFKLPNQIAKKGKEKANAITPILLEIENTIVKKGLYICKCGDIGAIERQYI